MAPSESRRLPPNLERVCLYDERLDVPRIEGWQLLAVAPIAAPHGDRSNHYTRAGVYTKLHVWNLTSYSAVLYLDLDTLPMRSVYPVFSQQLPAMQVCSSLRKSCTPLSAPPLLHHDKPESRQRTKRSGWRSTACPPGTPTASTQASSF